LSIAGLAAVGAGIAGSGCELVRTKQEANQDPLYPFVLPYDKWTEESLDSFLAHCSQERLLLIAQSLELKNNPVSIHEVKQQMIWISTNIVKYPFANSVQYHQMAQWVGGKYGIDSNEIQSASTFKIEHRIMEKLFIQVWDKLTPDQRKQALEKIAATSSVKIPASIALLGGSAALAAFSTSVGMAGFAFYTTMSSMICSALEVFGVVLPVAGGYTILSSTVATLTGPIGWAIAALGASGALAIAGSANPAKCAAFIAQMHFIKVDALYKSNELSPVLQNLGLA
jgi:uncharacterized protein YaaW (UPF0174 family)